MQKNLSFLFRTAKSKLLHQPRLFSSSATITTTVDDIHKLIHANANLLSEKVKPKFDDFSKSCQVNTMNYKKISIHEAKLVIDNMSSILPEHLGFFGTLLLENALPLSYAEVFAKRVHELKVEPYAREFLVRYYARARDDQKALFHFKKLKGEHPKEMHILYDKATIEELFLMKILLHQNYMEFFLIEMKPFGMALNTKLFNRLMHTLLLISDYDGFSQVLKLMQQYNIKMDSTTREVMVLYTVRTSNDPQQIKDLVDSCKDKFSFRGGCSVMKSLFDRGFYKWGFELFHQIPSTKDDPHQLKYSIFLSYFILPKSKENREVTDRLLMESIQTMIQNKYEFENVYIKGIFNYLKHSQEHHQIPIISKTEVELLDMVIKVIDDYKIPVESYVYSYTILHFAKARRLDLIEKLRSVAEKHSYPYLSVIYFNAVIYAYSNYSDPHYALMLQWVFDEMQQLNIKPNLFTFYMPMKRYIAQNQLIKALDVFETIIHPFVQSNDGKNINSIHLSKVYEAAKICYRRVGNRTMEVKLEEDLTKWGYMNQNRHYDGDDDDEFSDLIFPPAMDYDMESDLPNITQKPW